MAAPVVTFAFQNKGFADNDKVQTDFDDVLKYLRDRNDGSVGWDAVTIGEASATTGILKFFHASSANATSIQPGNATAAVTYTLPTAGPSVSGYFLSSTTAGVMSWANSIASFTVTGIFSIQENSPSQITADQNDYAIGDYSVLRLSTDASRTITGFAGGTQGRILIVFNVGSNALVLANQSASSTATNRIITGHGANITVDADNSASLWYDNTTQRWRVFGTSNSIYS